MLDLGKVGGPLYFDDVAVPAVPVDGAGSHGLPHLQHSIGHWVILGYTLQKGLEES